MKLWRSQFVQQLQFPQKMLNKTFYRFVFSFVAVIAGVLMVIFMLGVTSGGV